MNEHRNSPNKNIGDIPEEDWEKVDEEKGSPPENAAPESDNTNNQDLRLSDIVLPSGLQERYIKGFIGAFVAALITTILLVMYGTVQCCIGYIVAGALIYISISIKLDYANEKITELSVICTSVSSNIGKNSIRVGFRTNDEIPKYYSFTFPGNRKQFIENHVYVIYFRETAPQTLLAFVEL